MTLYIERDWTDSDLFEFSVLIDTIQSINQLTRQYLIIEIGMFVKKHGRAKCDLMFHKLVLDDKVLYDRGYLDF